MARTLTSSCWPTKATLLLASCLLLAGLAVSQNTPDYKNSSLPVEARVRDLLQRMTMDEKIAQLQGTWQNRQQVPPEFQDRMFVGLKGEFIPKNAAVTLKYGLGQMSRPSENRGPREMAEFVNTVQKWVKDNTRLGIPIMFHEECLHGHAAPQGTHFPIPIGLASMWDPALNHEIFNSVAAEVRARGAQQCLMPVLDLARDPRWGRTEETYGEDPYLVSRMGVAAVSGLQGNNPGIDGEHVVSTGKHFAVHGQPEGGTNVAPGNYSERVIREYFLKPFEAVVREAHLQSIMPSYNEVDGVPSHANQPLLDGILRKEWGFDGVVVSDYFAITDLANIHHVAADPADAARQALEAGVDIELPGAVAYLTLPDQVKSGKVPVALVDRAVERVLRVKFMLGLFDNPFVDPEKAVSVTNSKEHQALALKAAREAIVLLKNEKGLLPLDRTRIHRIAVLGPNAAEVHLGGYSDNPGRGVSILQGIRDKVGAGVEVVSSEGCKITENAPDWYSDKAVPPDAKLDADRIAKAVSVAASSDVAIVVVGENEVTSREAWSPTHLGDRDSLDLIGRQDELVRQVLATGKPTVVVLLHGRPNSTNFIAENAPAILDGWYLGQEGGTAMADVLFGDYNPGGKLPITVPRSVGQLPDYYYQKPSAKRGYLFANKEPLFPFGFGLSYTNFEYAKPVVEPATIHAGQSAKVSVTVRNSGDRAGDEVIQLYIRDEVSSVTRPVKELRDFRRIHLKSGESRTEEFTIGPEKLSFLNRQMKRVIEPGRFQILVGPNSATLQAVPFDVVE